MPIKPKKEQPKKQSLVEKLKEGFYFMRECPLCKKDYKNSQFQVLLERETINLVHCTCSNCRNSILSIVSITDLGISSIGVFTDLSPADALFFSNKEEIDEDNLLQFCHHISNKNILENFINKNN